MQPLHVLIDISALAAAVGAGAFLFQTRGRLRSAEAKRNALQSRLSELEEQRTQKIAEADATSAAVQATTEKLLEAANKRVAELEKTLQGAEKLKQDTDQQRQNAEKRNAEKPKPVTAPQQQDVDKLKQDAEKYRLEAERYRQDAEKLKTFTEAQRQDASKQKLIDAQRIESLEKSLNKLTQEFEETRTKANAAIVESQPLPLRSRSTELADGVLPRPTISAAKKTISVVLVGASRESRFASDIEKFLIDAEYKVVRATSMENIQTTARDAQPDLAILDLQIAGGDSLTALQVFKADSELRDIPTIIVCALKDRDRAIELGAAGCVVPPITSNVLLGTVKTAVINQRKRMERSRLAKIANTNDRSAALSTAE
jgi:CheY-like chemotaxis protein